MVQQNLKTRFHLGISIMYICFLLYTVDSVSFCTDAAISIQVPHPLVRKRVMHAFLVVHCQHHTMYLLIRRLQFGLLSHSAIANDAYPAFSA